MDQAPIDISVATADVLRRPDAEPARRAKTLEEAQAVAKDFEAMFLAQMLSPMFEGIATDGPFGGGNAERIYRSLLVQEYGKALASRGGIGLADAVAKELMQWQEGAAQ